MGGNIADSTQITFEKIHGNISGGKTAEWMLQIRKYLWGNSYSILLGQNVSTYTDVTNDCTLHYKLRFVFVCSQNSSVSNITPINFPPCQTTFY